ncbi:hypothetical protein GPECTOR_286g760 [Gonium pectorale]|uniref:Uncharacterized protein n=1 Tax=Gonium pectorale TaxID=33097 RepID=A0A150FW31_GONPE|nr:hypothetical protein GPECTOR_286g760 [Gonium pectorale]|eukprot:KXZ41778.1 hypothetical protein GPECTOR_286g760 [Gonium pectorale]
MENMRRELGMLPLEEVLGRRGRNFAGPLYDTVDPADDGALLLGRGQPVMPASEEAELVRKAMRASVPEFAEEEAMASWSVDTPTGDPRLDKDALAAAITGTNTGAMLFYRGEVDEIRMASMGYGRARSRHSYYFLVEIEEGVENARQVVPWVCIVQCYVRLPAMLYAGRERKTLRLLMVRLLKVEKEGMLYVARGGLSGPGREAYALPVSSLQDGRPWKKCIVALPQSGPDQGKAFFMPYTAMSEH